ncbi:MAG: methylcobamide--CoM methyltransferase MtbA [Denitrovibrio sp.]|nr:MAG: methylcobamide--CoM methyltransferase MtbA [Denitrovibrio sp.]
MNSLERILTALSFKEPDRVPFLLLLTMHGAKELGETIKDYYSNPDSVIEGQRRLQEKYQHDCYYSFHYASAETEAFGGDTVFYDDSAPNAGPPVFKNIQEVLAAKSPDISRSKVLQNILKATSGLQQAANGERPVIGVVMSPFSLPVMQLGFEGYLKLMYEEPKAFEHLMNVNKEFCVNWANAQLDAGATAICYFDPVSSPTITPPENYENTGFKIAKETLSQINGPTVTHFASGRVLKVASLLSQTGTAGIGVGCDENLADLKKEFYNKITIIGNLNGLEMCNWDADTARMKVKESIKHAAKGGGFILSDVHGEIPYQVKDDVLEAIREAVFEFGNFNS